jgi:hypothetical protein
MGKLHSGAPVLPFLFNSLWPGLVIWLLLHMSDYALTITCAKLYRAGVSDKIVFEGSFELNPVFQRDVDALKKISWRFIFMWIFTGALLSFIWVLTSQVNRDLYVFVLGSWILLELTVHVRHLRNLSLFLGFRDPNAVRGRIEYTRAFILRNSAAELFVFSALYLAIFAFTQSWFLLGGAVTCLFTGVKHSVLARAAQAKAMAPVEMQTTA